MNRQSQEIYDWVNQNCRFIEKGYNELEKFLTSNEDKSEHPDGRPYQMWCSVCGKHTQIAWNVDFKAIALQVVKDWLLTDPPLDSSDIGELISYLEGKE